MNYDTVILELENFDGHKSCRSLIPYFVRALGKTNLLSNVKLENCNLSSGGVIELLRSLPSLEEPLNMLSIADNHLGRLLRDNFFYLFCFLSIS